MDTAQPPATPQMTVMAMKTLINSLPEGRERGFAMEACLQLAWRLWGWNVERFRDELANVPLA